MLRVTELCRYSKDNLESIIAELRGYDKEYIGKANLGTFWHKWILRPERESMPDDIALIDAMDYRTKLAQEARDKALKEGKIPLLKKEYESFISGLDFLKPAINDLFPMHCEFEKEVKGEIAGIELIGHIDCIRKKQILDLKISEVSINLDKHIFDMRYNLQMYSYMLLSGLDYAELVFINPKALIIQIKTMAKAELESECEFLLEKAFKNMQTINKALDEPLILTSDYELPQWALANLSKERNCYESSDNFWANFQ